jgi:hypothetical protein
MAGGADTVEMWFDHKPQTNFTDAVRNSVNAGLCTQV